MSSRAAALWDQLREAGVVGGVLPTSSESPSPWYVRVMLGVSGWIAALFLLGFVGVGLEFVVKSAVASITVGMLALVAAFALFRLARNDFYEQFGLAVSFAGQALVLLGFAESLGWRGSGMWWMAAMVQVVIAGVMPNFVQRLVAAFVAVYALSTAMAMHGAPFITSVLVALAIAVIWLNEFSWHRRGVVVRPIGYGMTLALVHLEGQALFVHSVRQLLSRQEEFRVLMPPWVGELALGLLLVVVVARLLSRNGEAWGSRRMVVALAVAAVVAAVSLEAPGIATGLMIIVLGFANGNRILVGLGIAALLFYVSAYYYTLETTLLIKSEILAVTGVVLLLARWVVLKWVFPSKESSHA